METELEKQVLGTLNENKELYFKVTDTYCPNTNKAHLFEAKIDNTDGSLTNVCVCGLNFRLLTPNYSDTYPFQNTTKDELKPKNIIKKQPNSELEFDEDSYEFAKNYYNEIMSNNSVLFVILVIIAFNVLLAINLFITHNPVGFVFMLLNAPFIILLILEKS